MKMLLYTSGYQEAVAETLLKVKVKQLQAIKRNLVVCLMFDEVHLKKDISYCNAEDRIIGKHIHIPQTYCAQWGEGEFESGSHTNYTRSSHNAIFWDLEKIHIKRILQ